MEKGEKDKKRSSKWENTEKIWAKMRKTWENPWVKSVSNFIFGENNNYRYRIYG